MKPLRTSVLALALLAITSVAWGYTATKEFRETYPFPPSHELELRNVNGAITVTTWDKQEIEIYAEIEVRATHRRDAEEYLDDVEIDVHKTSRRIRVESDYPESRSGFWDWLFGRRKPDVRIRYWVKVPAEASLDLRTVNGAIEVENVRGRLALSTTNGRIEAHDVGGEVESSTVNGSLRIEIGQVDPEARMEFKTVNGSIRVYLPEDARADIDASTVNGHIRTDFPIETTGKYVGKRARGSINGGGALIRLRAVNGSISILRK